MEVRQLTGLVLLALLAACGNSTTQPTQPTVEPPPAASSPTGAKLDTSSADAASNLSQPSEAVTVTALAPATYCYTINNANLTGAVRLTVDNATQISGDSSISIHNDAAGYYSAYAQKFSGTLSGEQATLAITTWIEYDRQREEAVWAVTPNTLTIDADTFTAVDCQVEAVTSRFKGPDGLEAADLLGELVNQPAQRVQFASGTNGMVLENSVVRGDRDLYALGARGGQAMTLDIVSLEANAVFDVISPSGYVLVRGGTNENILLPQTGDYQIIVGGTRGNATYTLNVAIE